jgi:hypothetical protein
MSAQLKPLIAALQAHFDLAAGPTHTDEATLKTERPAWLDKLEILLAEGDFLATEIWQDKQGELDGVIDFNVRKKISKAMDNFDFFSALAILRGSRI